MVELGGLPLALDQAGAYIEETQRSLQEYLDLYRVQRKDLLARRGHMTGGYPASVATTWSLSFDRVEAVNPLAVELLRMCAFLAPDAIPEDLLREGLSMAVSFSQRKRQGWGGWFSPLFSRHQPQLESAHLPVTEGMINDAVAILRAYSLIARDADEKTMSLHRLVQVVVRDALPTDERIPWMRRAVIAVNRSFPRVDDVNQWATCERWLPHGLVCASWIEQAHLRVLEGTRVLNTMGCYLYLRGRYKEAEPLLMRALEIREEQLGGRHPDTAGSLNNLALLYQEQGKYAEAEPLLMRALEICEEQLGGRHPDTAGSLNNLALLYQEQGKYAEAEPLYQRALAIREQILGPVHSDTATSLWSLAVVAQDKQQYAEAEPLYRRALDIYEQTFGVDHLYTQRILGHYASLLRAMGRENEATALENPGEPLA